MSNTLLYSSMDMEQRVTELGFLPFFRCGIRGLSVAEMTPSELWFSQEQDGPWEWKGPVIREGHCAYGKMFNKKAGFVSLQWLPRLINYRRSLHLARTEDIAALDDLVLQTIEAEGSATTPQLRSLLGIGHQRGGAYEPVEAEVANVKISLEPILTRLMMETRIVISNFEYNTDRHGNAYGWGIARYATPESMYGNLPLPEEEPQTSRKIMINHLQQLFPKASESMLLKLI